MVADTFAALTALGTAARERLPARVVGITGSVGKTSTKDLLAAALGRRWRVSASVKSFNNELGVPLTVLETPEDAEAVVVEMGARGQGHIAALCAVARPLVGVVTTVGLSHSEFFGTHRRRGRAKGELVEALPADGTAVLNADAPLVAGMAGRGRRPGPDLRAEPPATSGRSDVTLDDDLRPRFRLRSPWGDGDVALAVRGHHQVANALAAAAAALACDTPLDDVAAGLGDARAVAVAHAARAGAIGRARPERQPTTPTPCRWRPPSGRLAELPAERRTALLGIMAELGDVGPAEHARLGRPGRRAWASG